MCYHFVVAKTLHMAYSENSWAVKSETNFSIFVSESRNNKKNKKTNFWVYMIGYVHGTG